LIGRPAQAGYGVLPMRRVIWCCQRVRRLPMAAVLVLFMCALLQTRPVAAQVFITEVPGQTIASALQSALTGANVHLHNLGVLKDGSYHSANAASIKWPISAGPGLRTYFNIPEASHTLLGRRYSYFIDHVRSDGVFVAAGQDSFTLTITLKSAGPSLIGKCVRVRAPVRDCLALGAEDMPPIQWTNAQVDIEMVPIRVGSSLAFEVRNVVIGGAFDLGPACAIALVGPTLCAKVNTATDKLRTQVGAQVKASLNTAQIRKTIAASVREQLNTTAQIPILGVRSVAMTNGVVRIGLGLGQ
jgi:hypothetical protein